MRPAETINVPSSATAATIYDCSSTGPPGLVPPPPTVASLAAAAARLPDEREREREREREQLSFGMQRGRWQAALHIIRICVADTEATHTLVATLAGYDGTST